MKMILLLFHLLLRMWIKREGTFYNSSKKKYLDTLCKGENHNVAPQIVYTSIYCLLQQDLLYQGLIFGSV